MAILITAAASSGAYRLARILQSADIYFADVRDLPAIAGKKFLHIPSTTSSAYAHEILALCLDNNITIVYPLHRDEVTELAKARQLFSEYGIHLVIPSDEWLKNKLNVFPFNSSNVLVLEKGEVRAGNIPAELSGLINEKNGVFNWILKDDRLIYSLFVVENAEI